MPRNRTARSAVLGLPVRRPAPRPLHLPHQQRPPAPHRAGGAGPALARPDHDLVPRAVRTAPLHDAQGAVASALQPLEVAVERVARPFRDAYGWTKDLFNARSENERLQAENEQLQQQVIQNESALQENVDLKSAARLPQLTGASRRTTTASPAEVISRPSGAFDQTIVVSAGSDDGVAVNAPVVTADGLVGTVTSVTTDAARVRLLTDESSAVSALDLRTSASGIVRARPVRRLARPRPGLEEGGRAASGDEIITAGWRSGAARLALSEGDHDRPRHVRRPAQHRPLPAGPGRLGRRLLGARLGARARLATDRCRSCRSDRQRSPSPRSSSSPRSCR